MFKSASNRRESWRPVLRAEIDRGSGKSLSELVAELSDEQVYEVSFDGRVHQVEVQILEKAKNFVHVAVSVDDGSLPASFSQLSESFIRKK